MNRLKVFGKPGAVQFSGLVQLLLGPSQDAPQAWRIKTDGTKDNVANPVERVIHRSLP